MDNHNIEAVIFDLGNVLVDFNHNISATRISKFTDKSVPQIFSFFFDSALIGLFEEGRISPEDFFLRVKRALNLKLNYEEFLPIWNEIFFLSEKNLAVYHLAKSLKKAYKLALLSNINILHFEYLRKNFSVFDVFHCVITSYKAGFRKPHPFIYQLALEALEVLPDQVFYTDDRPELTESAKKLGIKACVFKTVELLKKDLIGAGISLN